MLLTLAAMVIGFNSFASSPGQKYTLRFSPPAGTSNELIMDYTLKIDMDVMGQSMSMDQKMEMGANMKVLENTDATVKSSIKYSYMAMKMDNPMTGTMEYDSRTENTGMFAEIMDTTFESIMKKELIIVQDHTGKTIDTEGLDEIAGVKSSQGSLDFASVMGMSMFPEEPISIGDSWSSEMNTADSPMKFDITMTLKNVKDGKVYVDFNSTVTTNEDFSNEMDAQIDVTGTQTGTFIYNEKTMMLIEGLINQDMKMEVEQMGMKIPMTLTGEMMLTME